MTNCLELGADDLRIIGHSINCQLNVPAERILASKLSQEERRILHTQFLDVREVHRVYLSQSQLLPVQIGASNSYSVAQLTLSLADFRLMTDSVASFLGEFNHSPDEIHAITEDQCPTRLRCWPECRQ
jgi:hypothetical protein